MGGLPYLGDITRALSCCVSSGICRDHATIGGGCELGFSLQSRSIVIAQDSPCTACVTFTVHKFIEVKKKADGVASSISEPPGPLPYPAFPLHSLTLGTEPDNYFPMRRLPLSSEFVCTSLRMKEFRCPARDLHVLHALA
jgi:hypothetical protein